MTTTQDTSPTNDQATTEYHWVMSVQADGARLNTRDAIITVPANCTRQQLFQYVINQFIEDYGTPITVLFWDAQPNKL